MFEKNKNIIIAVVVTALVAGSGGYYTGKSTQKNTPQGAPSFTPGMGQFGQGGSAGARTTRNTGVGFVSGQIIAKDAISITVETRGKEPGQSGSKTIFLSASTEVMKTITGAETDLSIGKEITANGSTNPDGSITAKSIQIRPTTTTASVGVGRGMMQLTE